MQKFLVVGCGGSGAATVSHMMDQLKAMIRQEVPGWGDRLPKAWQFVVVDVPTAMESGPGGLPNIEDAGGTYISIGSPTQYAQYDAVLSKRLIMNNALQEAATWLPEHPDKIETAIAAGAGQQRAIGRVTTLQSLQQIQEKLEDAVESLISSEATRELDSIEQALGITNTGNRQAKPIVLVVASMAGGAGASMFLDVCRVLSTLAQVDPQNTAAYLLTPEVFEEVEKAVPRGWPNALAMFGEVTATQLGSASKSDAALFRAMGISKATRESTFARLFLVGGRMGETGKPFGDGSVDGIYRGLARALSAIISSHEISENFRKRTLANATASAGERSIFGWGDSDVLAEKLPWGSLGYARLSMGRDKYAEYSAQRLARVAFDFLLNGHNTNSSTSLEQLEDKTSEYFGDVLEKLCIFREITEEKAQPNFGMYWIQNNFPNGIERAATAASNAVKVGGIIKPPQPKSKVEKWKTEVVQGLENPDNIFLIKSVIDQKAYESASNYAEWLADEFLAVCEQELQRFGIPYLERILQRLDAVIEEKINPSLEKYADTAGIDRLDLARNLSIEGSGFNGSFTKEEAEQALDILNRQFTYSFEDHFKYRVAVRAGEVLKEFREGVLTPFRRQLGIMQLDLIGSEDEKEIKTSFADVRTDNPIQWPREKEQVSKRFHSAHNEQALTQVKEFPALYEKHLLKTVRVSDPEIRDYDAASLTAAKQIILGKWETSGGAKAPEDSLAPVKPEGSSMNRLGWWPSCLRNSPTKSSQPIEPRNAVFKLKLHPGELLERSRQWIARSGEPFETFISQDIRSYLREAEEIGGNEERKKRYANLAGAFKQAIGAAQPLVSVNQAMIDHLYPNQDSQIEYQFSEIPVAGIDGAQKELQNVITQAAGNSLQDFERSLINDENIKKIDIFGAYPPFWPIVYNSLLPAVNHDWVSKTSKYDYRNLNRSRPLAASLPLTKADRVAQSAGFILGAAIGLVEFKDAEDSLRFVRVFDRESNKWLSFPRESLTDTRGIRADWERLAVLMESILIAYAESHDPVGDVPLLGSLKPFVVLRGIFDKGKEAPSPWPEGFAPAQELIEEFLVTGKKPGNLVVLDSQESRYAALKKQINSWLGLAGAFIEEDDGYGDPDGCLGVDAFPRNRKEASEMPLLRDIAPDVREACSKLLHLLEAANDNLNANPRLAAKYANQSAEPGTAEANSRRMQRRNFSLEIED